MSMTNRPLTTKQQQFALEYCVDFNGTQAAIRAGYKAERAADAAHKLLKDSRVSSVINRARQCRIEALEFKINSNNAKERARTLCSIADFFEIDADGMLRFKGLLEYKNTLLNEVGDLKISSDGEVLGVKLKNPTRSLHQMMKIAEILETNDCVSL